MDARLPRPHGRRRTADLTTAPLKVEPRAPDSLAGLLSLSELLAGLAVLAPVLLACALVAWRVERRWFPSLAGTPRVLELSLTFTATLVAVHLVPGLLGIFTPPAVLVAALLAGGGSLALSPAAPARPERRTGGPPGALAAGAALLVAGCAVALVRDLAGAPVTAIDAQNFQVPIVARWLQTDSLWGLHQFIPDYSNATYPMHGNLLVAAVMLPFDSAFLARLVAVPYWGLAAMSVHALARELGAPRSAAVLGAAAFAVLPVLVRAGLEGVQTDAPMLAALGTGAVFLVRHARSGARAELVLAGIALGLAFGTKWYAVTGVAAVLAVWAIARRRRRGVVSDGALAAALVAGTGGVWLLRNWVETGNPVFPVAVGPFDAPRDVLRELGGFTLLHYATDWSVWDRYLLPVLGDAFGWTGVVLIAGALAAAGLRPRGPVLAVLAAAAVLALLYAATPYSAFGPEGRPILAGASARYGLPALLGAAALSAWAAGRLPGRARTAAELVLALAVLDGLRRGFVDLSLAKALGGTLAVAGAVLAARRLRPHPRALAAATAAALLLGLVAVDATRRRANDTGFGRFDPALAWIEANAASGREIGLAGVWSTEAVSPVLAAFGPRLGNEVAYLGAFREGMLRELEDPGDFRRALAGLDLLVVGRGAPPAQAVREEAWARAAGWEPVAASPRLSLWQAP